MWKESLNFLVSYSFLITSLHHFVVYSCIFLLYAWDFNHINSKLPILTKLWIEDFAWNWTNCSNIAIATLLKTQPVSTEMQNPMIIQSRSHPKNSGVFFVNGVPQFNKSEWRWNSHWLQLTKQRDKIIEEWNWYFHALPQYSLLFISSPLRDSQLFGI